jgi:hypothetical protein
MKFINEGEITSFEASSNNYMPIIDLDTTDTKRLVQTIGHNHLDDKLLTDINILEQNITRINTLDYSYTHLGTELQFSELSRGERVFLVSFAAKYTGESIYLQHDILQLTKTNLRRYYDMFRDCNNINIIYDEEEKKTYLEYAMQGKIR